MLVDGVGAVGWPACHAPVGAEAEPMTVPGAIVKLRECTAVVSP